MLLAETFQILRFKLSDRCFDSIICKFLRSSNNLRNSNLVPQVYYIIYPLTPNLTIIPQTMFSASSKRNSDRQNYSDPQGSQTLFEFLKRKKKVALQDSIVKNRSLSKSYNYEKDQMVPAQWTPLNQTKRDRERQFREKDPSLNPYTSKTRREYQIQSSTYRQQSLTPRRVRFADSVKQKEKERDEDRRVTNRSFIQMISPFKKKVAERSSTPESQFFGQKRPAKDGKQHYSRRNLNQNISILKNTVHSYIQTGRTVKEKTHSLFLELKPILKFVEENGHQTLSKKAEDIRLKVKGFQNLFKQFDVENSSDAIENFHRTISEHLNTIQAEMRAEYEKKDVSNAMRLKETKDVKIDELREENICLQKEMDMMSRKLEKSLGSLEKVQTQIEEKQEQYSRTLSDKINEYHQKLMHLEQELKATSQSLKESVARERQLQKSYKNAQYTKQENERKFRQESDKICSSKEEYLLNQIIIMKKQFQTDMAQITTLYNNKQVDSLTTISSLRGQISQLIQQRKQDKVLQERFVQEAGLAKAAANKFKKQNECLVTDMTRMNQQLYQHWLALKDVKTLAVRLQSFGKFLRIYDDLAFNDYLFG